MLPHISIEAPAIRNEKKTFDTIKGKLSEMLKFTIGLFQREIISMQSNFNSLQKPHEMSEQKCRAAILTDNKWSMSQRVQIFCLPLMYMTAN